MRPLKPHRNNRCAVDVLLSCVFYLWLCCYLAWHGCQALLCMDAHKIICRYRIKRPSGRGGVRRQTFIVRDITMNSKDKTGLPIRFANAPCENQKKTEKSDLTTRSQHTHKYSVLAILVRVLYSCCHRSLVRSFSDSSSKGTLVRRLPGSALLFCHHRSSSDCSLPIDGR